MADLRAVSVNMLPVFSCSCRSTDIEAMNVVEVIKEVQEICNFLNHIGKLLREEPTLGRVIASRKHVYVDGVNVRKLIEDMGYLILHNLEIIRTLVMHCRTLSYVKRMERA